jgi:hypothetical protein
VSADVRSWETWIGSSGVVGFKGGEVDVRERCRVVCGVRREVWVCRMWGVDFGFGLLGLDLRVVLGCGEVVVVVGAFAGSACESGRGGIISFGFAGVGSWIRGWETVCRFKVQCWSDDSLRAGSTRSFGRI